MAQIFFETPEGKIFSADDTEANKNLAVQRGFTPISQSRADAAQSPGQAFLEGAARTASLGLSDRVIREFSDTPVEEIKARKELNPIASTAGEVAGYIPMAVGTGGTGAAATAGRVALREGLTGGLAGLGSAISESTLENQQLTAETLASHIATGAFLGAGTSGVMSGLSKGASTIVKKVGGGSLSDALENAATAIESGQLAKGNLGGLQKLKGQGGSLKDVVKFARDNGIPIEFTPEAQAAAESTKKGVQAATADLMRKADAAIPFTPRDQARFITDLEDKIRDRFRGNIVAEKDVANFLAENISPLKNRPQLTYEQLYQAQSELRKMVKKGAEELPLRKEVFDIGRKELRDAIFSKVEQAGIGAPGELAGLQKDYARAAFLSDTIKKGALKAEVAPTFGMMDLLKGAAFSGGNPLAGVAGAVGAKLVREKGPGLATAGLRLLSGSKTLTGTGKVLSERLNQILSVAPEALGPFKARLIAAASHGPDALLQEHVTLAKGATGEDYLGRMGLSNETPEETDAAMARLSILDSVQAAEAEKQASLARAADGIFSGRGGAVKMPALSLKDFEKSRDSIRELLANPDKAFATIPGDLNASAPGVSNGAVATVLKAAQFLDSKIPKNPYEGLPKSVAQEWKPSAVDIDRFNRYKQAVESPEAVLNNLSKGYISPEQTETLKTIYPALYEDLRQKISERLMAQEKPITYQQKMAFGMLLGPAAIGMSPQQVQILQQATNQLSSGKDSGVKPDGRQVVDQNKNLKTQAQRLEER